MFRIIFEFSPDAIFIEDVNGLVADCNPAAAALHRTTRERLTGRRFSDLVPLERRLNVGNGDQDAPGEFDAVSVTEDGEAIPVSIRTRRIQYHDQPALLLHVRDITNRRLVERNLQASNDELELRVQSRTAALAKANEILRQEISERNRAEDERRRLGEQIRVAQRMEAVGRLAGGVAHDFNNLLTIISGRCEIMMGQLSSNHPMIRDVMLIHDAAQKAASVTRQLLAFGRRQMLQPKVLDLNTVISNMKVMLSSLTGESKHFKMVLGSDVWRVEADRGQIEQVIMNLVVNSIDAMSAGGELEITTGNAELFDDGPGFGFPVQPGHYAMFAVRDTGRGMDPSTLAHVYEPFFTTKDESKGTGLGLSTVYGIVKQSGGYIVASSEVGKGTIFRIYLPGLDRAAEPADVRVPRAPDGVETILVTEDAHLVRKLTRELLEARGYKIIEAANGEEALHVCRNYSGNIDLILSDIVMPNMNGRQLAEAVTSLRPATKILLMSGYADEITKGDLLRHGYQFIAKPFTSNALANKIREVLEG